MTVRCTEQNCPTKCPVLALIAIQMNRTSLRIWVQLYDKIAEKPGRHRHPVTSWDSAALGRQNGPQKTSQARCWITASFTARKTTKCQLLQSPLVSSGSRRMTKKHENKQWSTQRGDSGADDCRYRPKPKPDLGQPTKPLRVTMGTDEEDSRIL